MTWCNIDSDEGRGNELITPTITPKAINNTDVTDQIKLIEEIGTIKCPSCGHNIEVKDQGGGFNELPGLPAGVKFDPNDLEILEHLEAKVMSDHVCKLHPLIDQFIPTLQGENGICSTHPEKLPVAVATAPNFPTQINQIPMLNGMNFKSWKESNEIALGCMDLDLALREERPIPTTENSHELKIEKWDRSNRMCLMIIKKSIPEVFRGSIAEDENAKKFLGSIEKSFAKSDKAEISSHLAKLTSMKYNGKGNIREYIMEMSNLASKLKALKMQIPDDVLVHLVLNSLSAQFGQFVVTYNTQKDKWSLNELMSHCVQEEERLRRGRTESAHLASTSQDKKRKKNKDTAEGSSHKKKQKKQDKGSTCFFCKKAGHMKKDCPKYAAWRVKKGLPVEPTAE